MAGDALLVDATLYVFRAWFSMPDDFTNEAGEPVNAVYGFAGFLCGLLERTRPETIALAFDESLTTSFRNEIYPEYKANRDPAPEELKRQFNWCKQVAEALGVDWFADQHFEADDLIGTLARMMRQRGHRIVVISADKDLAQLINDGDELWDFARDARLDAAGVREKFGVRPDQMADFLALMGDSVDNIPGVPGIGAKSAAALLTHFDTLDALLERLEEVPFLRLRGAKRMAERITTHREDAITARELTIVRDNAPISDEVAIAWRAPDEKKLNRVFDELNFGPMLRRRCLELIATHRDTFGG